MKTLVVTNPFGGMEKGETITDAIEIESILAGENAHDVMQSNHETALANVPEPNHEEEN